MRIDIYSCCASLKEIVSMLCGKIVSQKLKVLLWHRDLQALEELSEHIWSGGGFLPHGLITQDNADMQPILFTNKMENINHADCLILLNNTDYNSHNWQDEMQHWKRVCDVFSASQDDNIKKDRMKFYKNLRNNIPNTDIFSHKQTEQESRWVNDSSL